MKNILVSVVMVLVFMLGSAAVAQAPPPTKTDVIVYLTFQHAIRDGELPGWHLHFAQTPLPRADNKKSDLAAKAWVATAKRRGVASACYAVLSLRKDNTSRTLRVSDPAPCASDFSKIFKGLLAANQSNY